MGFWHLFKIDDGRVSYSSLKWVETPRFIHLCHVHAHFHLFAVCVCALCVSGIRPRVTTVGFSSPSNICQKQAQCVSGGEERLLCVILHAPSAPYQALLSFLEPYIYFLTLSHLFQAFLSPCQASSLFTLNWLASPSSPLHSDSPSLTPLDTTTVLYPPCTSVSAAAVAHAAVRRSSRPE